MVKIDSRKFTRFINRKTNEGDFYSEIKHKDITAPITVLLGPNGSGKSMSLKGIENDLDNNDIKYVVYATSKNDIVERSISFNPEEILYAWKSEGERMIGSFHKWAGSTFMRELKSSDAPLWVLIDEADSGLSIDRLMQSFLDLIEVVKQELARGRELHIVLTANSYEMVEVLKSDITEYIWVPTKEKITIDSYEDFKAPYIRFFNLYFE